MEYQLCVQYKIICTVKSGRCWSQNYIQYAMKFANSEITLFYAQSITILGLAFDWLIQKTCLPLKIIKKIEIQLKSQHFYAVSKTAIN